MTLASLVKFQDPGAIFTLACRDLGNEHAHLEPERYSSLGCMCTALFAFGIHPSLLFFLAFNREEFFDRPTERADWWADHPDILGGRDLVRRGTWLGVSKSGKFAFLTNFREVQPNNATSGPSRGELTTAFLSSSQTPLNYLEQLDIKGHMGFNLVVGDMTVGEVAYITNRDPECEGPRLLPNGIYGLSNGTLKSKWPKTEKGVRAVQDFLDRDFGQSDFPLSWIQDSLMSSCQKAEDDKLPQTGMPQEVEKEFSSIFVQPTGVLGKPYGTHSQTVVTAWDSNEVVLYERTFEVADSNSDMNSPKTSAFNFKVSITSKW